MKKKHIPNLISMLRIVLVVPIAYFLWCSQYFYALLLFLIGGLSDGLDGFLARRYQWETKLGVILDPMGDKLMMLVAYLLLGWQALIPVWLVVLVILRDAIIIVGSLFYRKFIAVVKLQPLRVSKINTVCQIFLVLLVMLDQILSLAPWIIDVFIGVVAVTTVLSGYAYINEWGRRAWCAIKGKVV